MAVMGHGTDWAFDASTGDPSTTTFGVGSSRFDVKSDTVKMVAPIVESAGIIGSRGAVTGRTRIPSKIAQGTLVFDVSPAILDFFIEYMTGDNSTPYTLQETHALDFDFLRDDGATVYRYDNCIVTGWTLRGSSGGIPELSLNIIGKLETIDSTFPGTVPVLGTTTAYEPSICAETTIAIGGATRQCDDFELTVDHGITAKHRMNLWPNALLPGKRVVTFRSSTEWSAALEAIYYASGTAGLAASITIDRGTMPCAFTLTNLVIPDNAPPVNGPDEIMYGIEGVARGVLPLSTAAELSVTIDATP